MKNNVFYRFLTDKTPSKMFFKYYLFIILIGSFLLWLPISQTGNVKLPFLDSIFTATSAVSVTGLIVVSTVETFNKLGQTVIMLLIVCGGMGIMAIKATLYILLGLKLSSKNRQLVMAEQNQLSMKKIAIHVKNIVKIAFTIQTIGMILLSLRFYFYYDMGLFDSIWNGLFHSITAINNAGFDLFSASLTTFKDDYILQTIIMLLIIFGGIGFPVIIEISRYLRHRLNHVKSKFYFTVFTKLTVTTYFLVLLFGFFFILITEWNQGLVDPTNSASDKVIMALFQSVTSRNAGFNTANFENFGNGSLLVLSLMMFIGASPSSTGGGIRTTTFALVVLYINSKIKNKDLVIYKRRIPEATVMQAFITFSISIMLLFAATIIITTVDNFKTIDALFEVASAFGTTGLTVGITSSLSTISKLVIIMTMFLGQIGISTMLSAFTNEKKIREGEAYTYGEENVIIG